MPSLFLKASWDSLRRIVFAASIDWKSLGLGDPVAMLIQMLGMGPRI